MFNEDTFFDCALYARPPCHLVLSTRRVLATVLTILLQCFLSAVTSLSYASIIPVTSCISSIHFLLGRPLLLLASIIPASLFSPPVVIKKYNDKTKFRFLFSSFSDEKLLL